MLNYCLFFSLPVDLVVFLSDVSHSLGSIFLWNWREQTCCRFKMLSAFDGRATNPGAYDGTVSALWSILETDV